MGNFIYDNTPLYLDKVDPNPVTIPTQQWSAEDSALVKGALLDVRSVLGSQHANVLTFGAVADGVTDTTAALQAAINASAGIPLYFPKGKYKVSSTLLISSRSHRLIGDFGNRAVNDGTEIQFFGTGPCIQIGTDDGNPWNANEYNGPQDQVFENIWISHGAPDTALVSNPGGALVFKTGAYGIWDWRGGQIAMRSVGIEGFEANFAGVQSDINSFLYVISLYSKYGIYIGPRSDQFSLHQLLSFSCDRAVTIDGAVQTRIVDGQLVGCGTPTASAIEIRQGSAATSIERPWFEHLNGTGYTGTDQQSFMSVGEVTGYGTGGSIQSPGGSPNTAPVEGCNIDEPMIYTELGGVAGHTKYAATVGKCRRFALIRPASPAGIAVTNLDSVIAVQAAQAPTGSDTQIFTQVDSGISQAKTFTNLGAGSPTVEVLGTGTAGFAQTTGTRFFFNTFGAAAGADQVRLSQEGNAGEIWLTTPNLASGQTTRLRMARSLQTGVTASSPSIGTVVVGDRCLVLDPVSGGHNVWVCTGAGNPGTWAKEGIVYNSTGSPLINVATGVPGLIANRSNSAETVSGQPCVRGLSNGSFDTTAGFIAAIALQGQAVATRSAGASTLQNIGGQFTASGAQDNQAVQTVNGDVQLNTGSGITHFNTSVIGVGTRAAAPSTGTHIVGEIVLNVDPVASGFIGWVCITGGSPGTWKSWGAISP